MDAHTCSLPSNHLRFSWNARSSSASWLDSSRRSSSSSGAADGCAAGEAILTRTGHFAKISAGALDGFDTPEELQDQAKGTEG